MTRLVSRKLYALTLVAVLLVVLVLLDARPDVTDRVASALMVLSWMVAGAQGMQDVVTARKG